LTADKKLGFPNVIYSRISQLSGPEFQNLIQAILKDAGFKDVIQQSSGSQGGFDIRAKLHGLEWRFEAKKTKGDALAESDLAEKFDQIEHNPGETEYYIIVTNTNLSNDLKRSIVSHRNKWYIDLDYWSSCNDKFRRILLSYPNGILQELSISREEASSFLDESQQYLKHNKPFLEEEYETLLRTSNRFNLLQAVANFISKNQEEIIQPATEFSKLIARSSANAELDKFRNSTEYPCFFLISKEQMGKSSLMRLWKESLRKDNIVFFFSARNICSEDWLRKFQQILYPALERSSLGKLQGPEYIETILDGMQARLKSRSASIYIFVDGLNTAQYGHVQDFFSSVSFNQSLTYWDFHWVFSCREAVWEEWKDGLKFHRQPLIYRLREFNDTELEQALKTHGIDLTSSPYWLVPKLRWPGLLRLYERIQFGKLHLLESMPEMALAEMSLLFIKDRIDEFLALHPGGIPITKGGIEQKLHDIVELFTKERYHSLPLSKIQKIDDFNPHYLSENSWNILLQQGFLTKNQDNYELGNDWASILIGKYLIDTCLRKDVAGVEITALLDDIFDGIAPVATSSQIKIEESEKFTDVLWFALHYGKICNISETLFRQIMDRIFDEQNLAHDYLCSVGTRLFPIYSVRYLASATGENNKDLYMREGLEQVPAKKIVPELIKLYHDASDNSKLQMAILLNRYDDIKYLEDVYSLLDRNFLPKDERMRIHVEDKLLSLLQKFPDQCCSFINARFDKGMIDDIDLAINLIGLNGTVEHRELLMELISHQSRLSAGSLKAMGRLRVPKSEKVALRILENEHDLELQVAAIEALGDLKSRRFLKWCYEQTDLWKREYYQSIICSLQKFETSIAYDLIISLELSQTEWIPFFFFYSQNRIRKINKKQFLRMIEGILEKIEHSENYDIIWRGLHNISSLNSRKFKPWFEDFQGTRIPRIIAALAKTCAKPESFSSRGQTLPSMAMDEALKILDWIGDKEVIVYLLLNLIERNIPRLFCWTLFPFIVQYADVRFKDALTKLAEMKDGRKPDDEQTYELIHHKAITCLTYLEGEEVADTILNYRGNSYSEKENSLSHFYNESFVKKLIQIFKTRDETLFWSAYCFLWEFLPEEAVEPSLTWLDDPNCKDWVKKYLARLIGKYDKAEYNSCLLKLLNSSLTEVEVSLIDIFVNSNDAYVHNWFKKRIASHSTSPIAISSAIEKKEHKSLIQWIRRHQYKEAKNYIQRWIEARESTWLTAQWLIYEVYDLIAKFEFWEFLEPIKNKYYCWNPQWGSHIIKATFKLVYQREPEWAWREFLKYWNNASDFHRKDAIKWVEFMPSKISVEWLIGNYPNVGNFFSDEKEIRRSIRLIINNFPKEIRQFGIEILQERTKSDQTVKRIHAAICSGLFGEEIYKQFSFLSNDQCSRVRASFRYADMSETELMSAV